MTTRLLKANPAVTEDRGRVAFQRGPVVFCMEHIDQKDHAPGLNMADYTVHLDGNTVAEFESQLLGGVMVLSHPGAINRAATATGLYFPADASVKGGDQPTTLKLIPYYAWVNRVEAAMQVWIPYRDA